MKMTTLGMIAFILVVIGALNWGLIGIFNFDIVGFIFGTMSVLARIIYALVGLSGIYMIVMAANRK
jgi:hypothetical protein